MSKKLNEIREDVGNALVGCGCLIMVLPLFAIIFVVAYCFATADWK